MILKIKPLRKEMKMSQRAVAEKIGCSQKSVDCWEKGASEPTAGFVCALADCFACTTDYLLGREDDFGNVHVDFPADPQVQALLLAFLTLPKKDRDSVISYAKFLKNEAEKNLPV